MYIDGERGAMMRHALGATVAFAVLASAGHM